MTDSQTLAMQDANEEGVAAELYGTPQTIEDTRPVMTLEQVREEATRRLTAAIEAAGGEEAPVAAEMVDVLSDIEDDEFWDTSNKINPPTHALLLALMGVELAQS